MCVNASSREWLVGAASNYTRETYDDIEDDWQVQNGQRVS